MRMGRYRQLNFADRIYLEASHWEQIGKSGGVQELAYRLQVHRSTIYRELRRGSTGWMNLGYRADYGEKRRRTLARNKGRPRKIVGELEEYILARLREGWSPEQIAGRRKQEGKSSVSYETIYRYLQTDRRRGGTLYLQLRHGHRRRRKRFAVPRIRADLLFRRSIENRPQVVAARKRIGDWERDLMFGGDSRRQALLTLVERKTGFVILRRVSSKSPAEVARQTIEALRPWRERGLCRSLTNDNGFEFREHRRESRELGIPIFFTHPYSSWERGTNENANGLIRQYFPKGSSIEEFDDEKAQMVQARLNARPRKGLGFLAPLEAVQRSAGFALLS